MCKAWCQGCEGPVHSETWSLILEELEVNFEKPKQHTGSRKSLWTGCKWLTKRTPGDSAW